MNKPFQAQWHFDVFLASLGVQVFNFAAQEYGDFDKRESETFNEFRQLLTVF